LVTIQLPIYNEKYVVERLLSIAALEYPREKLEIQVLDALTIVLLIPFNFEISKHWIGYQTHYPKQQWF
jgi:hypothetical protein